MGKKLLINILKFALFFSIGLLLLWLITKDLSADEKSEIWKSFGTANYFWVGLSVGIGILSHVIRALRWKMMIEPLGYQPRLKTTFYSVMIGYITNMAVPRLGELTRCGIIQRYEKVPFDKALGTLVVERSIDFLILVLAAVLMLLMQFNLIYGFFHDKVITPIIAKIHSSASFLPLVAGVVILLSVVIWFSYKKFKQSEAYVRMKLMMMNVRDGIYSVRHIKNFKLFIFYSLFIWVCYFLMVYVCFNALPQTTHFGFTEALAVLVFGTVGIISTPGGIGAYHLIVTETLVALYGLDKTYAISFSWLAWSCQTVMIITIGLISLLLLSRVTPKTVADEKA